MELKKGIYVRTLDGFILRLSILTFNRGQRAWYYNEGWYPEETVKECDIVKSSESILDILEEGDFINGEAIDDLSSVNKDNIRNIISKALLNALAIKV